MCRGSALHRPPVCVCVFWNEDYSRLGGDLSTHGRVAEIYACIKDFLVNPELLYFLHRHTRVRDWETPVDLTTHGSSVVKSTCILRWPRVPTSTSKYT